MELNKHTIEENIQYTEWVVDTIKIRVNIVKTIYLVDIKKVKQRKFLIQIEKDIGRIWMLILII